MSFPTFLTQLEKSCKSSNFDYSTWRFGSKELYQKRCQNKGTFSIRSRECEVGLFATLPSEAPKPESIQKRKGLFVAAGKTRRPSLSVTNQKRRPKKPVLITAQAGTEGRQSIFTYTNIIQVSRSIRKEQMPVYA